MTKGPEDVAVDTPDYGVGLGSAADVVWLGDLDHTYPEPVEGYEGGDAEYTEVTTHPIPSK